MLDLIEALKILSRYSDNYYPTSCENETLFVLIDPMNVNHDDIERLHELSFIASFESNYFYSVRFGGGLE